MGTIATAFTVTTPSGRLEPLRAPALEFDRRAALAVVDRAFDALTELSVALYDVMQLAPVTEAENAGDRRVEELDAVRLELKFGASAAIREVGGLLNRFVGTPRSSGHSFPINVKQVQPSEAFWAVVKLEQ